MVSARANTILERFPSCLELTDPDKTFAFAVDQFSTELDVANSTTGRIRKNHRIGAVDNEWDLQELIDLHDLRALVFEPLSRRLAAVRAAGQALIAAPDDATLVADTRALLPDLLALQNDVFPAFPDEEAFLTEQRLGNALIKLGRYRSEMGQRRELPIELIDVHATGNGTVSALLRATTALLALKIVGPIEHHEDGYWHFATCRDRLSLTEPQPSDSELGPQVLTPISDIVGLEENPFQPADVQPAERWSRQQFAITRAGWEEVPVTVRVIGIGERCMAPMVVNRDTGAGVVFTGAVGDGQELRFERTGQISLDGADVSPRGFSFVGAVFADDPAHAKAFVWADEADETVGADRAATFTQTKPLADGFRRNPGIPHGGGLLDAPTLLPDKTRWAFFVREAHFGRDTDNAPEIPGGEEIATATYFAGVFDASVFDPTETDGTRKASAEVGFEWEEREAFALCIWLPRRFEALDGEGEEPIREQIRILIDRFRAAGIHVRVKYADDRWTLGVGIVREADSLEPMGTVIAGTAMWPTPTE